MVHINHTIKYCKKHHFGDDTNSCILTVQLKKLFDYPLIETNCLPSKRSILTMKQVSPWINAVKIYLNLQKKIKYLNMN